MVFQDPIPPEPCVSLVIHGRLLTQEALEIPETGPDEIIIRWPWRLSLRVDRVIEGEFSGRRLDAVGIQHTEIRKDYGKTFLFGQVGGGYRLLTVSPERLTDRSALASLARQVDTDFCEPA